MPCLLRWPFVLHATLSLWLLPVFAMGQGCLDATSHLRGHAMLDSALYRVHNLEYAEARELFASPHLTSWPLALYFKGLFELQTTEDLGDTLAFYRADSLWPTIQKSLEKQDSLLEGLTLLQWAGTQQKQGNQWRALKLSLQARKILLTQTQCPEAQAGLALLDYYREQLLPKWLPGGGSPEKSAQDLFEAATRCQRLKPLLLGAWIWTQFDFGQWDKGLQVISQLLEDHPNHRLYLQMQGDFQFRKGDLDQARLTYEKTLALYPKPNQKPQIKPQTKVQPGGVLLPLGYLACAGNLARIEAALHHPQKALEYLSIWENPGFTPAAKWLPSSLQKALKPLRSKLQISTSESHSKQ